MSTFANALGSNASRSVSRTQATGSSRSQIVGGLYDYDGEIFCGDIHTQELSLDGVAYELLAYPVDEEQFSGSWRCNECGETDGITVRAECLEDALEFARFSLIAHHQFSHQGVTRSELPVLA